MSTDGPCMLQVPVPPITQRVPPIPPATQHRDDKCPLLKRPRRSEPQDFIPKIIPYGTFYILGYNGFKPPFNRGRVKSYCQLIRKYYGDGVKYMRTCIAKDPQVLKAALASKSHNVIYKFSVSETVIVQYARDSETDLFQIGRSAEPPIDFVVMDVNNRHASRTKSTVSRYACRILADRKDCKDVRVYAAGFNESCNIFLGEKAIKWTENGSVDGLTTNGVLLNHPQGDFWGGDATYGTWREVSVNGKLFTLRPVRDSDVRGIPVENEDNKLKDGSLIDLCGATVIWRTAEGLKKSIKKEELHQLLLEEPLLESKEMYSDSTTISSTDTQEKKELIPHVHWSCGHVQHFDSLRTYATCPVCLHASPTPRSRPHHCAQGFAASLFKASSLCSRSHCLLTKGSATSSLKASSLCSTPRRILDQRPAASVTPLKASQLHSVALSTHSFHYMLICMVQLQGSL